MFVVVQRPESFVNALYAFQLDEGAQWFDTRAEVEDFLVNAENPLDWVVYSPNVVKVTF